MKSVVVAAMLAMEAKGAPVALAAMDAQRAPVAMTAVLAVAVQASGVPSDDQNSCQIDAMEHQEGQSSFALTPLPLEHAVEDLRDDSPSLSPQFQALILPETPNKAKLAKTLKKKCNLVALFILIVQIKRLAL